MKRNASFLMILVLLSAVFCSCDGNRNASSVISQQAQSSSVSVQDDSSVSAPPIEDEPLEDYLADYYVEGIPILENNFYIMLTGDEIFKDKEPEIVLQTSHPVHAESHTTFYRDSDFYWIFASTLPPEESTPWGIIITNENHRFGIGLHPGMTVRELEEFSSEHYLDIYSKEESSADDFFITYLLNYWSGLLELISDYDSIYCFMLEGLGSEANQELAQSLEIPTPYCYGFLCFVKDEKVIAIATDLPTAG